MRDSGAQKNVSLQCALYFLVQRLWDGSREVENTDSLVLLNKVGWDQIDLGKLHWYGAPPPRAALDKMWVSFEKGIISNEF